MIEVLEIVFQSFWTFMGTLLLLTVIAEGMSNWLVFLIAAIRNGG